MGREITIIIRDVPDNASLNDLIQWYGASLGLFSPRDKDSSCFRVFITLFRAIKEDGQGLKSDDIAERTDLSRGTVVHHLNKLRDRNIVAQTNNKYFINVDSLESLTNELRREVNDALDDIEAVAKQIDEQLGL